MFKRIKRYFKTNKEITKVISLSLIVYIIFEVLGALGLVTTYPVGIFQKIVFAILAVGILWASSLKFLKGFNPKLRELVDRNNVDQFEKLPLWLKYSFAFGSLALLFWGLVTIASKL